MRRLRYSVEMHVEAEDADQLGAAKAQLLKLAEFVGRMPVQALSVMPTGGITGAPRDEGGPGWMAVLMIQDSEEL